MLANPFMNTRRTTIDEYEFQEYWSGWEVSHTDTGYWQMLVNKAAHTEARHAPFRIVKRRVRKDKYTPEALAHMEAADLKAKIDWLIKLTAKYPDNKMRNRNRQFQIEQAQRRIAVLN